MTPLQCKILTPLLFALFSSTAIAGDNPHILWQNSTTGAIKFMPVNGMTPESTLAVVDSSNTNLLPKGMGDFTGDGKPDILFHNQNSGNLRIWEMDGSTKVNNIQVLGSSNTNLKIAGIGDFDGDGDNDIATFNTNSGSLRMWVMEGTERIDNVLVLSGANTNLVPRGAGDMDGDGIPDIVLRNNNSGTVRVWTMNDDLTRKGNVSVTGSSNTNLELRGVIDINKDGNNDILNYNTNTGKLRAWLMDGSLGIIENAEVAQDADFNWSPRSGISLIDLTDIAAPVITLAGDNPLEITQGETFTDPGANAVDNRDGSVPVTPEGGVDMSSPGEYTITYTAEDKAGNKATASRKVIVTFNGSVVHVADVRGFREALRDAAANGVNDKIVLAKGYYITSSDGRGAFTINDNEAFNLVIEAEEGLSRDDVVLDGNNTDPVFVYLNSEFAGLKLERITVQNAKGVGVDTIGNTVLESCKILYNSSAGLLSPGNTIVKNSIISDNGDRGFFSEGNTTVDHCTITRNGQGGFSSKGYTTVDNTLISDNNASRKYKTTLGAGFYSHYPVKLYNSRVVNNHNKSGGYYDSTGGGFHCGSDVTVVNSEISGNTVYGQEVFGAGIYAYANVEIVDSNISDNTGFNWGRSDYANGGGLYSKIGSVTAMRSNFINNRMDRKYTSSRVLGGAIKAGSITKIEKCKFIKNHADSYGGAIHVDGNEIIINSIFIENSAPYGGAIFAKNSQSYLINNNFIGNNNKYTDGDLGAAIQGQGIFINNIFDQNYKDITIIKSTSKIYNNYIDMVKVVNYNNESVIIDKNNLEPYYDGELYLNDDNITLQSDSPVINKGLNLSSSTFRDLIDNNDTYDLINEVLISDILGNKRIHNGTIDMGVAEYDSSK